MQNVKGYFVKGKIIYTHKMVVSKIFFNSLINEEISKLL